MNRFFEKTAWTPTIRKIVAGALPYTRYNIFKRWMMRRIVRKAGGDTDITRDYEYTDWSDLSAFARTLMTLLSGKRQIVACSLPGCQDELANDHSALEPAMRLGRRSQWKGAVDDRARTA